MNHTPANVSSTKRKQLINPQCFVGCYHSHTDSFTGDREQPPTDYQVHPRIHCREFTLALIALGGVAHCSSAIALLLTPANSLARTICKAIATTYHKRIVDTGKCKAMGFENVTQLVIHANKIESKESFCPAPSNGGFVPSPTMCESSPFSFFASCPLKNR
jgi:hypothetical protein